MFLTRRKYILFPPQEKPQTKTKTYVLILQGPCQMPSQLVSGPDPTVIITDEFLLIPRL